MSSAWPGATRYRLTLEYDGGRFFGWQRQEPGTRTVQGVVEEALTRLCGHPVLLVGAGRTDTGVHALGQVAHFDTLKPREPEVFRRALNVLTPPEVTILDAALVPSVFNARRAAWREYRYRVLPRRAASALERDRVWHHPGALDLDAMNRAARYLVGKHDFSAFRSANCQSLTPVREVHRAEWIPMGEEIHFVIRANAFLYHMVRNIVGTLVLTGRGKWSEERFVTVFTGLDRRAAGPMAPAHGLYLSQVHYQTAITLP
ncbi:tRNA pseudouridine synthase A [Candidatus Magnetaquicoccaceae bacterium FCR-1]|uniref:tRNA pseudouridine synthase A n=1 Tax=Candidatus Magnetaquiglobus chichijimensis TaxID=3141448 RepID=A0ABQ0C848_9PROT